MKKISTLVFLLTIGFAVNAQLLVENFDFTGALTANGWSAHSGTGTNPVSTTTGLTYTGYTGSGVGNAALVGNAGGEDVNKALSAEVSGDGSTVYFSALVNVTDAASNKTGDYFLHIGDRQDASTFTSFAARVFVRIVSDAVNFGISNTSTATYGTTNFAKNTTYLIVVKYTISNAGNDPVSLWVFPTGVPASEAAAGTAEVTVTSTAGTSSNLIDAIALRQGSSTNQPQTVVDAIRVSTGWFNAPLPVSLLSFNAAAAEKKVNLNWSTSNELNLAGFEVQRSINGKDFAPISLVEASGATSKNYSFVDENAVAGLSYYRLKMTDKDGSFKYSIVAPVKIQSLGVSVYPNPVKSVITLQHEAAGEGAVIAILDLSGKQTMTMNVQAGAMQTTLNAARLAPGSYLVVFNNNGTRTTKQFIKE